MKRGEREDRREAAELNALTEGIIGAAIKVHRELGPGLLEPAYEACLHFELGRQGYSVAGQKPQPVGYDGLLLDCGYRLDLLVEEEVVVELKAAAQVTKLDERQLLTYLRLADCRVGLLINFNVLTLVEGVKRADPPPPQAGLQAQEAVQEGSRPRASRLGLRQVSEAVGGASEGVPSPLRPPLPRRLPLGSRVV